MLKWSLALGTEPLLSAATAYSREGAKPAPADLQIWGSGGDGYTPLTAFFLCTVLGFSSLHLLPWKALVTLLRAQLS